MGYPRELIFNSEPVASPSAVDNGLAYAYIPSSPDRRLYLMGITADYSAQVAAIKTITIKRGPASADGPLTATVLAIGSTDTAVSSTAFHFLIARRAYFKAAVAAGTALAAGTIPQDTWGIYRFTIDAAGTITSTAGAANFTTGYASEALAIAALPAVPASQADMGYVTVLTGVGHTFIGGTDALQGGASGNPSSDTNYYPATAPTLTTVGAPFRWDFTNGPFYFGLPGIVVGFYDQSLVIELEASGTGGITGRATAWCVNSK